MYIVIQQGQSNEYISDSVINNLLKIIELLGESKFFNFDTEEGIKISTND